tara:strand:+ start:96 stop:617 length:522 start_codon:yes stop_codon:yes gene_type:complete
MELTRTTLPSVLELQDTFSEDIGIVYSIDPMIDEYNGVILSVTADTPDTGVTIDIDGATATISGRYEAQFAHSISWAAPQSEDHEPPVFSTDVSWGDVPDPGDPSIWYLYAYRPPPTQTTTITYTIQGTFSRQIIEEIPPDPDPIHNIPFSFQVTQTVNYDLDANVAEFMGYV